MNNLNEVVEFLIMETFKQLKNKTGRTPGFNKVILIIKTIVMNNYAACLSSFLSEEENN